MPRFDQTGPVGQGPMTGRRMGRCTNWGANAKKGDTASSADQAANPEENIGRRGFGFGLGWRRGGGGRGGRGGRGRGLGRQ